MNASQLIAYLNAIELGEVDGVLGKIEKARAACLGLEQAVLSDSLEQAAHALTHADLKTYRKRIETVIAKLGHLR